MAICSASSNAFWGTTPAATNASANSRVSSGSGSSGKSSTIISRFLAASGSPPRISRTTAGDMNRSHLCLSSHHIRVCRCFANFRMSPGGLAVSQLITEDSTYTRFLLTRTLPILFHKYILPLEKFKKIISRTRKMPYSPLAPGDDTLYYNGLRGAPSPDGALILFRPSGPLYYCEGYRHA